MWVFLSGRWQHLHTVTERDEIGSNWEQGRKMAPRRLTITEAVGLESSRRVTVLYCRHCVSMSRVGLFSMLLVDRT